MVRLYVLYVFNFQHMLKLKNHTISLSTKQIKSKRPKKIQSQTSIFFQYFY